MAGFGLGLGSRSSEGKVPGVWWGLVEHCSQNIQGGNLALDAILSALGSQELLVVNFYWHLRGQSKLWRLSPWCHSSGGPQQPPGNPEDCADPAFSDLD